MTLDKNQKRTYSIEPYNLAWIHKFNEIKEILLSVFGDKAVAIEHVGSTSIPGMKAKPIIDVLITVKEMESFNQEREIMARLGYKNGDNYIEPNSILFYKEDGDRKIENIHVCVVDSFKAHQFICMRKYFRVHPEKAKEYTDLKEKLNKEFPNDYPAYRAGKGGFLDEIEKLSKAWENSL